MEAVSRAIKTGAACFEFQTHMHVYLLNIKEAQTHGFLHDEIEDTWVLFYIHVSVFS